MLQFPERLRLDLTDPLAGHAELLADFLQGVVSVHADAETHAQNPFLTRGERGQNPGGGLLQVFLNGRVQRQHRVFVLDEIAQLRIFLVPDRGFERDRLLGDLHHLADLLQRHLQFFGQFFRGRLAANLMQHLASGADQLVDGLDHMDRDPDGAGLIGNRTGDGLTNPPGRIGRELVTAAVFKFVHRLHQADVAFLDQIQELQAAVGVFLGDRDHQAQVGLDHLFLGLTGFFFAFLNLLHDAAEFRNIQTYILADLGHLSAQIFDLLGGTLDEHLPATTGLFAHLGQPVRIQLAAAIGLDEFAAVDTRLIRQFHHVAVDLHHTAVDTVKLVDQRFDPVVVQMQPVYQFNDL
ncbi:hypothetical protein RSK20926_02579 [Roseobacter sp. SK209-2-6]|nr:hypothetical protein RSK20926_02579 [Roseobacter sp. SK209-2-6]